MKRLALMMVCVLAGCGGGGGAEPGKETVKPGEGGAAVTAPAKSGGTLVKRPTGATQPRNPNEVPQVFLSRDPDSAKASIAADSAQSKVAEEIMQNRIAPRKTAVPFTRNAIPDPDDRANMPSVPVVPDSMPAIPGK